MPPDFVLSSSRLRKTYRQQAPTGESQTIDVLEFPTLEIPRGRIVAIVGGSGCGKSTLLSLLAGLAQPDSTVPGAEETTPASIVLRFHDGLAIDILKDFKSLPRNRIGFVFQDSYLLANMTVGLNVALPALSFGEPVAREDIEALLSSLSLPTDYRTKRAWQLSGGEAQRVAVARAIANDPEIVFADEPTSNLDHVRAAELMSELKGWVRSRKGTILWVTHDLPLAFDNADLFLVLKRRESLTATLREKPKDLEALETWALDNQRAPSQPRPLRKRLPRPALPSLRLAFKMGASEVFSSQAALADMASQQPLSARLAKTGTDRERIPKGSLISALAKSFNDFNGLSFTGISFCLAFLAALVWLMVDREYNASLVNPLNCHVQVIGRQGTDTAVDAQGLGLFGARKWENERRVKQGQEPWPSEASPASVSEDGLPVNASCKEGPAAFGRRDTREWDLGLLKEGRCARTGISIRLLVTYPNEPMLSRVKLGTVASVPSSNREAPSLVDYFKNPKLFPQADDIFLTEYVVKQLRRHTPNWPGDQVCLDELGGADQAFNVKGILDDLPSPVRFKYDAFLTESSYLSLNRNQREQESYTQVTLYFDPSHAQEFENYLKASQFLYSEDNIKRLKEIADSASTNKWRISGLAIGLSIIFGLFYYNWIAAYLAQNAKAFAVVKSFGLQLRTMVAQTSLRIVMHLAVTAMLWTILCSGFAKIILTGELAQSGLLIAIASVCAFLAILTVGLLMTVLAAGLWWRRNRYVARTLASG